MDQSEFNEMRTVLDEQIVMRAAAILGEGSGPARAASMGRDLRARGQEPVYLKEGQLLLVMSMDEFVRRYADLPAKYLSGGRLADFAVSRAPEVPTGG